MKGALATLSRELRAYFFSPLAYAILTLFLLVNGFIFWVIVSFLSDPRARIGAPLELFFGQTVYFWLVLLCIVPVLTMRLLAEERKSGTIEVLMTAPVTETQVVLGKYFAALLFYLCLWLPTLVYVAIIARHADVDPGPVAAGYLGVLGVGALFLAVGVFASSVARNQIVAAVLTFALLVLLFSFGLLANLVTGETLKKAFAYLDLWQHMDDFAKGLVDTRRVVYYVSGSAFFLFLATRALAANKWR
ncbi:MAG TPA: ABC transporter permease subunit [Gemmatimonadales bacterium]|nr:ABC transporter permease subunit [Gemmatimonadales bacterium]